MDADSKLISMATYKTARKGEERKSPDILSHLRHLTYKMVSRDQPCGCHLLSVAALQVSTS
jgi:hypothetical protein